MRKFKIRVDGEEFEVEVEEVDGNSTVSKRPVNTGQTRSKTSSSVSSGSRKSAPKKSGAKKKSSKPSQPSSDGDIVAPMPGTIVDVMVAPGEEVSKGQDLMTLEAMKMENNISAPHDGTINEIKVESGDKVDADDLLIKMG